MFAYYFSTDGIFAPHILFWEAFVSLALLGFGSSILRLLRQRVQPLAVAGAVGLAAWICLGGWLSLANAATKPILIGSLCLGSTYAVYELIRKALRFKVSSSIDSIKTNRYAWIAGIPIGLYFAFVLLAHLRPTYAWNVHDDVSGYIALAEKTSALGGLQPDPFSERRITAGLGGGLFLTATMLAGADDSSMGFLDAGFGYVLYILCLWSAIRRFGLSPNRAVWVLYLVPLLPLCKLNLTIIYTSAAFFLALLLILIRSDGGRTDLGRFLLVGLIIGAASTLKSSNIPFLVLLPCFCVAISIWHKKFTDVSYLYLLTVASFIATIFPWSRRFRIDEGTWFFPTLGRGDHISAFGFLPLPSHGAPIQHALFVALPNVIVLTAALLVTERLTRERPSSLRTPVLAFMLAATTSVLLISITLAGEALDRYSLPFEVPALLLCAAFVVNAWRVPQYRSLVFGSVPCAALVLYCHLFALRYCDNVYDDLGQILTLVRYVNPAQAHARPLNFYVKIRPQDFRSHAASMRLLQSHIPSGEAILEANIESYGYDWRRNTVYIADYPGMASALPGMPILGSSEDLRHYLLDHGIHYVVLDRNAWKTPGLNYPAFLRSPAASHELSDYLFHPLPTRSSFTWSNMEWRTSVHTYELFSKIAAYQPTVYSDGDLQVVSLRDTVPATTNNVR